LPLLPEDWLPRAPKHLLAGDFLETSNYGVRGADGTRFYAQMKHALVYRKDFDAWLIKHLLYPSERSRERKWSSVRSTLFGTVTRLRLYPQRCETGKFVNGSQIMSQRISDPRDILPQRSSAHCSKFKKSN
jgi:hypothetical protein